jgi:hypothetical protein
MILADDLNTPVIVIAFFIVLAVSWWSIARIHRYIDDRRYSPVRQALKDLGKLMRDER